MDNDRLAWHETAAALLTLWREYRQRERPDLTH